MENKNHGNNAQLAKCQDLAEKLNLLGSYVNRTRRVQVKENRPLRDPLVIPVDYSKEEMQLYQTILQLVRARCRKDNRPFHVFQILGLQLRAASCLPALAKEIRDGRFGDPEDLFYEAMGEEIYDGLNDDGHDEEMSGLEIERLLSYDFEINYSKYQNLRQKLREIVPNHKFLIYA